MQSLQISDRNAYLLTGGLTAVVLALVVFMYNTSGIDVQLGFELTVFPKFHAVLNSLVSLFLVAGLVFIKQKNIGMHRASMGGALLLSVVFLLSYVFYHSISETTVYGGEGSIRYVYYFLLASHIILAAVILPFILMTFIRALSSDFQRHRKLARFTWPVWFYVSLTGVIVYFMISPYY